MKRRISASTALPKMLLTLAALCASVGGQSNPPKQTMPVPIYFQAQRTAPIRAIVRIAVENQIPIGFVLGSKKEVCMDGDQSEIDGEMPEQAFSRLLRNSNYTVSNVSGVYIIRASDTPQETIRWLETRIDKWDQPSQTMSTLGMFLSGYVYMTLHPGSGYGGEMLSGVDEEKITTVPLYNVSAEQVANAIVKQGHGGIWVASGTYKAEDRVAAPANSKENAPEGQNFSPMFSIYNLAEFRKTPEALADQVCK